MLDGQSIFIARGGSRAHRRGRGDVRGRSRAGAGCRGIRRCGGARRARADDRAHVARELPGNPDGSESPHHGDDLAASFARIRDYCAQRGIEVVERHWRSLTIRGPIGAIAAAFGTACSDDCVADGRTRRSRPAPCGCPRRSRRSCTALSASRRGRAERRRQSPPRPPSPAMRPRPRRPPPCRRSTRARSASSTPFRKAPGAVSASASSNSAVRSTRWIFRALFERDGAPVPVVVSLVRVDDAAPDHAGHTAFDDELLLDVQIAASLAPGRSS